MKYVVVNFSGGKDSTAMLLHMLELGEHIDEVVFCDTWMEFPSMYEHVSKIRQEVEKSGIKFSELRSNRSFEYYMFEHKINTKLEHKVGYSWPRPRVRWCTHALKLNVIDSHFRMLRQKYDVINCIGIAADETKRLERENNKKDRHRHPLIEWNWTEADCLKFCYDRGFDWGGLYEQFHRVSCWCCPLQSLSELRMLRKHHPELWEKLLDMECRTWCKFRADYSVDELEIRFAYEDRRIAEGLPINGKYFQASLHNLLSGGKEHENGNRTKQGT